MIENANSAKAPAAPRTRAERRRAAADATARWRGMRQAVGMPEAHVVDRALSEAMSFCLQPVYAGHDGNSVQLSLDRIYRVAVLVLMRLGADRDLAQQAIRQRLSPRASHSRPTTVPNFSMHEPGWRPPPCRKGDIEWTERDLAAMKAASRP